MKVVITGGGGFIGSQLTSALLERGYLVGPSGNEEPIQSITLIDISHPSSVTDDPRIERVVADATDDVAIRPAIGQDDVSVFHLASMVSAACENDFDAAINVNVRGAQTVLNALRTCRTTPRVVFTSSMAAFGSDAVQSVVSDETKLTPETTYGITKAIVELLVNDYTRKGYVDGRSARLPTVIIRPGRPNAAASSWVSGIFREPLNGQDMVVPVDIDLPVLVTGYRTVVHNLIALHDGRNDELGSDRAMNLPAIAATANEMTATLCQVAGERITRFIRHEPDELVSRIFASWPQASTFDRALKLGLKTDTNLESIIQQYIADFMR
ncbi:MAG TPA: D-erythronate dehydrogenase [Micromonosporaceae bacterium]|nr:D-erythronate dehydrogenase [Micromonosporaceae bacterium]